MDEIDLSNAKRLGDGEGSFGDVHLVEKDGRQIVVKTLKYRGQDTQKYDAFKKECDTLVELDHPNIIKTIPGSGKVLIDGLLEFGILTEYCEMGTLKELIRNVHFLYSMKNVTIWSGNLFDALDYLWEKHRKIHRDIKPANIFVTKDFIVKLGDFGMTKEIDQSGSGTFDVGTNRYCSPPQLDSNKTSKELLDQGKTNSSRNDVYALGLVIWELVERRLVFAGYETQGAFDLNRFMYDLFRGNLKGLDPPKCLREFQEIVESCCDFNRLNRPLVKTILNRLKDFNKNNPEVVAGYPRFDSNLKELIRPIGFDQLKNPELIPVTSNNSISF